MSICYGLLISCKENNVLFSFSPVVFGSCREIQGDKRLIKSRPTNIKCHDMTLAHACLSFNYCIFQITMYYIYV